MSSAAPANGRARKPSMTTEHAAPPSASWWCNVPADQFTTRAAEEQARMQGSRFGGKTVALATEAEES